MSFKQLSSGLIVSASFAESAALSAADAREIASTKDGRDITRGYISATQQLPIQDTILQARGGGNYNLYRDVLRDWQVKSTLAQRQLAVVSKGWEVEPGGKRAKDKAAAAFLEEQLKAIAWDKATNGMLFGVFYGHAVAEMLWGQDGSYVTIDKIKVRDRRRFAYDGDMNLRLMTTANQVLGELVPPKKFWSFCTGADHDDEPYGLGLAHWLYRPVFFKRNDIKFWLIFLEKFGQPTAIGKYPGNATPEEKTRLLNALGAIATESGIIVPDGMLVDLLEAARSGTGDYTAMHDRMDAAISKVVLGHTGSSDATPGRLGGEDNAKDVRDDLVKADADLVCSSFNEGPARWLTEWNFPGAAIPRVWRVVDEGEDLEKRAKVDQVLHTMGYEPDSIDYINETYGGSWKKKEPPKTKPPGTEVPAPNADESEFAEATPAVQAAVADQQDIDAAADAFGADFENAIGKQVDAIIAFAEETGDLNTMRERLGELLKGAPAAALTQALERGAFSARLLGRTTGTDAAVDFKLTPAEALRFFREKGLSPTFAWQDMLHDEHDRAFTIAKMMELDLLTDVRDYIDYAMREGLTTREFIDDLKPELQRRGWWGKKEMADPDGGEVKEVQLGSARRLRVIYETNLRTAYTAGHWEQIEINKARAPYVMYSAILDGRTRPAHAAWNGKVLRADDPWWQTHTPPNGWNCRCTVIQLGPRDLKAMGKSGPDKAPADGMRDWTNPRSGEVVKVPVGVDPGWGYAPGASKRAQEARDLLSDKAQAAPADLRAAAMPFVTRKPDGR